MVKRIVLVRGSQLPRSDRTVQSGSENHGLDVIFKSNSIIVVLNSTLKVQELKLIHEVLYYYKLSLTLLLVSN